MIDIDHFKVYNDAFGHQGGDDCLRAIGAMLLNNAARARDLVARTGGEEMAVIMPEVDLRGALVVAERMRAAVAAAAIPQGPSAVASVRDDQRRRDGNARSGPRRRSTIWSAAPTARSILRKTPAATASSKWASRSPRWPCPTPDGVR